MAEHKTHKETSEHNKEHNEHHHFFTKPVVLAIAIGIIVIIAVVIALTVFMNRDTRQLCSAVQGTCRTSCLSSETNFNDAKCGASQTCCITTPSQNTVPSTPAAEPTGCYDSDGNDPNTFGYVKDINGYKHSDICQDSAYVIEATCGADGTPQYAKVYCPYDCKNGACLTQETGCFDSDYSNIYLKGYVKDINDVTKYDICKNEQTVTEYICGTYGYVEDKDSFCANGCTDGACAK